MNCQKTLANYVLFLVVCIGGSKVSYCDTLPSVLMPVLPHSTPGAKSTSPFKEMQALRALGQVDEAIRVGQVYLSAYPRDADILLLMGLLFYQKEDFTTSGQYLTQALAMSPTYLDAKLALINVYVAQNDLNQAGALIREVVQQAPNDPRVQAIQVSFKTIEDAKRTNPDKGGSLLESVVNSYPSRTAQTPISPQTTGVPSPWHEMRRLRAEGQLDRALEIGKGYLKKQPQDGDVLLQMGLIWAQKKEFTLAVQSLKQVLTLAPNYLDAKLSLITIYIAQNQLQQAASFMMQVKQQAPSDPRVIAIQTLFKRAILENKLAVIRNDYQKGRLEEARILALQALAQDPANADVRLILGRIYLTQKQYTQAKKEFEYLLQQNQQNKDASTLAV